MSYFATIAAERLVGNVDVARLDKVVLLGADQLGTLGLGSFVGYMDDTRGGGDKGLSHNTSDMLDALLLVCHHLVHVLDKGLTRVRGLVGYLEALQRRWVDHFEVVVVDPHEAW
jgi:hypothetical protein|tara:strand:+ start:1080 stop:1421 length:342 start_codon:yes stop_codon:yes gene_type:complete